MNAHRKWLDRLVRKPASEIAKNLCEFKPRIEEEGVLYALCRLSVETSDEALRARLLELLKERRESAGHHLSELATASKAARIRKWALVNMSLLGCRNTQPAVLQGLEDPDFEVATAAALSTGLYDDEKFLKALERFFEKRRFAIVGLFCRQCLKGDRRREGAETRYDRHISGDPATE